VSGGLGAYNPGHGSGMSYLTYRTRPTALRRPVLLMAFGGWNDAAEAATNAVR